MTRPDKPKNFTAKLPRDRRYYRNSSVSSRAGEIRFEKSLNPVSDKRQTTTYCDLVELWNIPIDLRKTMAYVLCTPVEFGRRPSFQPGPGPVPYRLFMAQKVVLGSLFFPRNSHSQPATAKCPPSFAFPARTWFNSDLQNKTSLHSRILIESPGAWHFRQPNSLARNRLSPAVRTPAPRAFFCLADQTCGGYLW